VIDTEFVDHVADRLAALPGVTAVSLGGSRAVGTHRADSDWDLAIYYRDRFDPQDLRDLGWPGEVSEIGGWGGGVFNGGAWLTIDGRRVDVHYRDLAVVEHQITEAEHGRFEVEPLLFHLAGIPTYLVVAELALNRVLRGSLPRPVFPEALRASAPPRWWGTARMTLDYARSNHAPRTQVAQVAAGITVAACQAAHAVLAARGEWVTNEKTLLDRANVRGIDGIVAGLRADPHALAEAVDAARALLTERVDAALNQRPGPSPSR